MCCPRWQQSIVLDSNWMWVHKKGGYVNCYTGNQWDKTICPDPKTCAEVRKKTSTVVRCIDGVCLLQRCRCVAASCTASSGSSLDPFYMHDSSIEHFYCQHNG